MSYALRFDGTQLFASFSPTITVNLGSAVADWSFEFRIKIEAGTLASSGSQYIFGSPTTTINGIYHRPSSGIGALAFAANSAFRFASAAGFLLDDGEFHTYKIYRNIISDSSNLVRFFRDGVEFNSAVAWSTSVSMSLAVMSRASPTGTGYFGFELDYCTYQIPQSGVYTDWQADLAGGTGTTLFTTDNSRDATISGYTVNDNSWWINTTSGVNANVDLIKSTITTLAKSISIATSTEVSVIKSYSTVSSKSVQSQASASVNTVKSQLNTNSKLQQSAASATVNLVKSQPVVIGKLIVGQTDASVSASVNLLKSTETVASKLLITTADCFASVIKLQQSVLSKTFNVSAGANVNLSKSTLTVVGKLIIGSTDVSVDAIVTISKGAVTIQPLIQNLIADANSSILINKAVVKEYDIQTNADAFVNLNKSTLLVRGRLLQVGREPAPIGIERIFAIEVDEKIFSVINEQTIFTLEK